MIQIPPVPPVPQVPTPPVIVQGPEFLPPWMTLPPQVTLIIALGFFAAVALVLRPLMTAIGRRLEGRHAAQDPAILAELDQLRQRVQDLEGVHGRVMELEERLDFAERLLSQRREVERLSRGEG